MKISPRLKKMFNFLNKPTNRQLENEEIPCDQNLYSNFYFNISPKLDEVYETQSSPNTSKGIKQLTEENVKKIPKMKRSKSVEDWLNDVDDSNEGVCQATKLDNVFISDKKDGCKKTPRCCDDWSSGDLHYACVDVTTPRSDQSKLFASSSEIFRSYSSFSTFQSSFDSSVDFLH